MFYGKRSTWSKSFLQVEDQAYVAAVIALNLLLTCSSTFPDTLMNNLHC